MSSQTHIPTVLLIDYEPKSIASFLRPLRDAGYQVEVANDGVAGLEAYERLKPDLVLVEAMLPKKHGFEVCQTIKQSHDGRGTPVLITTAVYKGRKYRNEALTVYGCDEYIEKPISAEHLLEVCDQFLSGGSTRLAPDDSERTEETDSEVTERPVPVSAGKDSPLSMLGDLTEEEIVNRLDSLLDGIQEEEEEPAEADADSTETEEELEAAAHDAPQEEMVEDEVAIEAVEAAEVDEVEEFGEPEPFEEVAEAAEPEEAPDPVEALEPEQLPEPEQTSELEEITEPEEDEDTVEAEAAVETEQEVEDEPDDASATSLHQLMAKKRGGVDLTTHNVSDAVDNLFNELAAATDAAASGPQREPEAEPEEEIVTAREPGEPEAVPFGPAPRPEGFAARATEQDEREWATPVEDDVFEEVVAEVGLETEPETETEPEVATPVEAGADTSGGLPKWIWPVAAVVVLGIGAGLYFVVFGGGDAPATTRPATTTTAQVRTPPPTPVSEPDVALTGSQDATGAEPVEHAAASGPVETGTADPPETDTIDLSGGTTTSANETARQAAPQPARVETRTVPPEVAPAEVAPAEVAPEEVAVAAAVIEPPAETEPEPVIEQPAREEVAAPPPIPDMSDIAAMPVASSRLDTATVDAEQALMPAVTAKASRGDLVLIEEVDTAPVPVKKDPPAYHPLARRLRQEGDVTLSILVDHTGKVEQVKVANGIPKSKLNDSAVAAARRWVYSPAIKDGVPVRVWITETLAFRL